jgi:hypothetical protein
VILRRSAEDPWKTKKDDVEDDDRLDREKGLESPTPIGSALPLDSGLVTPASHTVITEVSRQLSRASRSSEKAEQTRNEPKKETAVHASALRMALVRRVLRPLRAGANSITITLVVALVIAIVKELKALFVDVSHQGGPSWHGPDGRPPLAFVVDTGAHPRLSCSEV